MCPRVLWMVPKRNWAHPWAERFSFPCKSPGVTRSFCLNLLHIVYICMSGHSILFVLHLTVSGVLEWCERCQKQTGPIAETFSYPHHPGLSQLERIPPRYLRESRSFAFVWFTPLVPGGHGVMPFFVQKGANKQFERRDGFTSSQQSPTLDFE